MKVLISTTLGNFELKTSLLSGVTFEDGDTGTDIRMKQDEGRYSPSLEDINRMVPEGEDILMVTFMPNVP